MGEGADMGTGGWEDIPKQKKIEQALDRMGFLRIFWYQIPPPMSEKVGRGYTIFDCF
jgi:hypothetical protein